MLNNRKLIDTTLFHKEGQAMKLNKIIYSGVFAMGITTNAMAADPFVIAYNSDWPPYSQGIASKMHGL